MMSLQEAIEEVKQIQSDEWDDCQFDFIGWMNSRLPTAIAIILNAIVKGELK